MLPQKGPRKKAAECGECAGRVREFESLSATTRTRARLGSPVSASRHEYTVHDSLGPGARTARARRSATYMPVACEPSLDQDESSVRAAAGGNPVCRGQVRASVRQSHGKSIDSSPFAWRRRLQRSRCAMRSHSGWRSAPDATRKMPTDRLFCKPLLSSLLRRTYALPCVVLHGGE